MAEARARAAWARTSAVLALIANVNRDPKKRRPFTPADFDPYATQDRRKQATPLDMNDLRRALGANGARPPRPAPAKSANKKG